MVEGGKEIRPATSKTKKTLNSSVMSGLVSLHDISSKVIPEGTLTYMQLSCVRVPPLEVPGSVCDSSYSHKYLWVITARCSNRPDIRLTSVIQDGYQRHENKERHGTRRHLRVISSLLISCPRGHEGTRILPRYRPDSKPDRHCSRSLSGRREASSSSHVDEGKKQGESSRERARQTEVPWHDTCNLKTRGREKGSAPTRYA